MAFAEIYLLERYGVGSESDLGRIVDVLARAGVGFEHGAARRVRGGERKQPVRLDCA